MKLKLLSLVFLLFSSVFISTAQHSVAREWNEVLLGAIRVDFARPTVHARNLFHTSALLYDAWAVYDDRPETFFLGKTVGGFTCNFNGITPPADVEAAREETMSYAAYRLLLHRFANSPGNWQSIPSFHNLFLSLGYNPGFTSIDYGSGSPAALGNYMAECMINFGLQDGANEAGDYTNLAYQPVNPPMVTNFSGNPDMLDPNRWQPLTLDFIDQGGNPIPFDTPPFLSPEWGIVTPFSLKEEDLTIYTRDNFDYWVYHDPGDPPYLDLMTGGGLSEEYKWGNLLVAIWSGHLDPTDGVMWDISPGAIGNTEIDEFPTTIEGLRDYYKLMEGGDIGTGHDLNPATGMPYEPNVVARADYARVLAEFWADGPDSETPPGHWFTLLNYVNDHAEFEKKYRGEGDIVDDLEWDVKAYFIMGGAMHDVAIAAWGIKGWYDYTRPVTAIRYIAGLGQCSDESLPSYHVGGIPLVPNYVELVDANDELSGDNNEHVGKIKLFAWRGPDYIVNEETDEAGVGWILAENWWPYQRPSFVTPPFAGYISGHSTYSRAAAEVMTMLSGDAFFPGGMGEFEAPMNEFLVFEDGPSETVTLQWATYRDASDQTSLSRIWGGIHPPADDIPGRLIGETIGVEAFEFGESYFFRDEDQDGWYDYQDCDDNNPDINPGVSEVCDGVDNNCSGFIDDGLPIFIYFRDNDNDGYGDFNNILDTCLNAPPASYVLNSLDCDDNNEFVNPAATEVCDDIDNNCSGIINDGLQIFTYYRDVDIDGYGDGGNSIDTCLLAAPIGYVTNDLDCNDNDDTFNPDIPETCDGLDNDCNGLIDDGLEIFTYYRDNDNDNYGDAASAIDTCQNFAPMGYVDNDLDCDDEDEMFNPEIAEICDGMDNDCNGMIDDGLEIFTYFRDNDNDGFGDPNISVDTCQTTPLVGFVANGLDCDDIIAVINPNAPEFCDGIDNNCDGNIDEGLEIKTFYPDNDNDGYGNPDFPLDTCLTNAPLNFTVDNTDCDDTDSSINPGATDNPDNHIDEDCDGTDLFKAFKMFPNPTSGELTIHYDYSGPALIQIIGANAIVLSEQMVTFENNSTIISLSELAKGIYFVQVINEDSGQRLVEKIVKY